ncbi:MAG: class I SAM-dependent methyltransferase [Candidatus Woesearchaeota archaeon]|nr:class I SAM-dependent methyltransferase [Candidatus Woesearchaeota archaeon]
MATNVKPDELNYDHYETKKYDDDIARSIPGHEELHRHIDQIIQREYISRGKVKVLELGVGTGLTAERILRQMPNAEYTAVDFSEQMLAGARRRLSQYNITFVNGDYSQIDLPNDNDLVVSVVGIHHQKTNKDKKSLFQKIYHSIAEDGSFIFGDLVTYKDRTEAALNEARHYHHLVEHAENEESLREWAHHHKFLNKLAPLENQVKWLREIGFREVNVVYQKFNTALVYAKK